MKSEMAMGEQTSLAERKRRAGQRLIIGFEGLAVDDDLRKRIALVQPAGFLLDAPNVAEVGQVLDLGRELASLVDEHRPPMVAVRHEGGSVQPLAALGVDWPSPATLGRVPQHVADVSRVMARQLRALGVHLNFAPVARVRRDGDAERAPQTFSADSAVVARCAGRFVQAHQAEGIMACAVLREPSPAEAVIAAEVAAVQIGAVPRWLRRELAFEGPVFSEDVVGREGPDAASRADGCDGFVVGAEPELQVAWFEALVRAQEQRRDVAAVSAQNDRRLLALRERFWLPVRPPADPYVLEDPAHQGLLTAVRLDDPLG